MSYLVVNGGKKLKGTLTNQSSKNSAVAILCAALMIKGKTTLVDVPQIEEVDRILELLSSLGVRIVRKGSHELVLDTEGELTLSSLDRAACEKTRSSLFLWGALAARVRSYRLFKSGGCHLGQRTVRPHWYALQKLGVTVTSHDGFYEVKNKPLTAAHIVMYESGDMATENVIMAAVLAEGVTTISMASANYMVQDLCYFLVKAGAKIGGIGTTKLTITGVKALRPVKAYPIMPDPIVAMTYLSAAITTGSTLTINNCPLDFLELELYKLEIMGQRCVIKNKRLSKNGAFAVVDIEVFPSALKALPDKIECRPFPGLNIDNLPLFAPILSRARGRTMLHDWVFENRTIYLTELQKLGVNVQLIDPHRAWIEGPSTLRAAELVCPPAIRPAVNVLICMLAAKGKSILRNTYMIDRGYEDLYETLRSVGADIQVVKE